MTNTKVERLIATGADDRRTIPANCRRSSEQVFAAFADQHGTKLRDLRCQEIECRFLEVLLDEFAEAFVVFLFHVDELDAAAVGADVTDDGCEVDFVEAGADF